MVHDTEDNDKHSHIDARPFEYPTAAVHCYVVHMWFKKYSMTD